MSQLAPLKPVPLAQTFAHSNDEPTLQAYRTAVTQMIQRFSAKHGRKPTVLCLGALDLGAIPDHCIAAGAHHVTVCDPRAQAEECESHLAARHDASRYTVLNRSPLKLPAGEKYDVLVHNMFGGSLNAQSAVGYVQDLLRRGVVAPVGDELHVLPMEASMTVRLYHVPSLSVDARRSTDCCQAQPVAKRPKILHDSAFQALSLSKSSCVALSDRVEVAREIYDTFGDDTVQWPACVHLRPHRTDVPVDECLIVYEWSAVLSEDGSVSIGTVLGSEAAATPEVRRARSLAWGHDYIRMDEVSATVAPVLLSVAYRPGGGVALAPIEAAPKSAGPKTLSAKKLQDLASQTYAKILL